MPCLPDVVARVRFYEDRRLDEVEWLLQSHEPVSLHISERPGSNDHERAAAQQQTMLANAQRASALPLGRAALTFRTRLPELIQPIPAMCWDAVLPPKRVPTEYTALIQDPESDAQRTWPEFHNAVAAYLCTTPHASACLRPSGSGGGGGGDHRHYLQCGQLLKVGQNPRKDESAFADAHLAGQLLAAGLQGELAHLHARATFHLLARPQTLVKSAVVLGLAVARRGSADDALTRVLMMKGDTAPLDLYAATRPLALGLLHQGRNDRRLMCMLLHEMTRTTGSSSTGPGLAMGLVGLGKRPPEGVERVLKRCFTGGTLQQLERAMAHLPYPITQEEVRPACAPACINTHALAPGALLAWGLLHLQTSDRSAAACIPWPSSASDESVRRVRPDHWPLCVLARYLILWDAIEPSRAWIEGLMPWGTDRDQRKAEAAAHQVKEYVHAGACWMLGLRFAGSADARASGLLEEHLLSLVDRLGSASGPLAIVLEDCCRTVALASALVLAGTGELWLLRLLRRLHGRLVACANVHGHHLAVHLALGLLFLSHGRSSLRNDTQESIAALVMATYPCYPHSPPDQSEHLQMLRYMWVLAAEERCLITRLSSGQAVSARVAVEMMDGQECVRSSPCLLPRLDRARRMRIECSGYEPVVLEGAAILKTLQRQQRTVRLSPQRHDEGHGSRWDRHGDSDRRVREAEWLLP